MFTEQLGEEAIFQGAREIDDGPARRQYLDRACDRDHRLRRRVDSLLAADQKQDDFLKSVAGTSAASNRGAAETAGERIGRYKLLEQIGEGGMGIVYVAEQTEPVHRRVALKIIKPGMDTRQVIARFEAERQTLAMMDHPNIARIIDAGTTGGVGNRESGVGESRPFFVMEHVRGVPVNEFCDQQHLAIRQRLELFFQVCQAVQHAHQKGVIHRDLKPSNILVTMQDAEAVPKVIDFGIAKAVCGAGVSTAMSADGHSFHTDLAQLVGTPLYMSPEQAEMNQMGVDTRTDVYSLGVMLYELLTGTTPFDKDRLKSVGFDEMRRIIREEEPETVSQRMARTKSSRQAPSAVFERDGTQSVPATELDWIVARALEKDRTRRYESASAFAADIQRYLNDEPVQACPPTARYRFEKFAKKHRAAIAASAAIALCLILGTTISTWQAVRAAQAESQASANEQRAVASEQKAIANEQKATANAAAAQEKAQEAAVQRDEAQKQRDEAQRQRDEVRAVNDKLVNAQQRLQSTLYGAHINLAQQAWESGAVERVVQFLDQHRPKPGEADIRGFEWHYLNRLCHAGEVTLEGHADRIASMTFRRDGKRLATVSVDHAVKIWDTDTGKELVALNAGPQIGQRMAIIFSPDGQRLASVSTQGIGRNKPSSEMIIWNAETGVELGRLKDETGTTSVVFSPDNNRLAGAAFADSVSSIKIWEIQTAQPILNVKITDNENRWINALTYSPDGKRLAVGLGNFSGDGNGPADITLWDAQNGQLLFTLKGHNQYITSLVFQPDGKRLASTAPAKTLRVWDTETGQGVLALKPGSPVNGMAYSPDGKRIAAALEDKSVTTWDAETGQELTTFKSFRGNFGSIALRGDGHCLVTTSEGQMVTLKKWDEQTSPTGRTLTSSNRQFPGVLTFSPDGKLLATPGVEVQVWDVATGKEVLALKGHTALANNQAFSPNGKLLATASRDQTAKIWDVETGRELKTLSGYQGAVAGVRFRPDGKQLATASWDGTVKLWDTQTWNEQHTFRQRGMCFSVAYSPDGKQVCGGFTGAARVWDPETGRVIHSLPAEGERGEQGQCIGLVYSPDCRYIAGACGKTVFIWDAQTGRQIRTLVGATDALSRVAYTPDGKRLAASGWDRTMRLWDVENGVELLSFKPSSYGVAFSPDGYLLAIARPNGGVEILDGTPLSDSIVEKPETAKNRLADFSQNMAASRLPNGWTMSWRMDSWQPFTAGVDADVKHGGAAGAFIERQYDHPTASIGMIQTIQAGTYAGKRVRLAAYVKTLDANRGARVVLHAIGETMTVRDYMEERQVTGTTDWTRHEIVVDVPKDAPTIDFGFELTGKGRVWADDFQLEVVSNDVPTTKPQNATLPQVWSAVQTPGRTFRAELMNVDFEGPTTLGGLAQAAATALADSKIAEGWRINNNPENYEAGLDSEVRRVGQKESIAQIEGARAQGFANMGQTFRADDYRGKRVRLSGYVKVRDVVGHAVLSMRVDNATRTVALDLMDDRQISGTKDWKIYDNVLDVPQDAVNITIRVVLTGSGQAWFDDLQLEPVGPEYLTTSPPYEGASRVPRTIEPASQPKPLNLDFER